MDTRTRFFMLGSAGLILLGLCTGLVAYYAGFPGFSRARQVPDDLKYIPAGVEAVAFVNVRDVMASDLRQRVRALGRHESSRREEFFEKTGIDIENDVDQMLACWSGADASGADGSRPAAVLVVMRGRFDDGRLDAAARERGAEVHEHRGHRMLDVGEAALVFVEPGVLIVGTPVLVRRALDIAGGGQSVTSDDEMMRQIGDVTGHASLWAVVGGFDALARRAIVPDGVRKEIPAVRWLTASGRVNGGIEGLVRAETRDLEAAQNLRDVVQGLLALARLQSGSRPELTAVLRSLELGGTGRTVSLSFAVPAAALDGLRGSAVPAGP